MNMKIIVLIVVSVFLILLAISLMKSFETNVMCFNYTVNKVFNVSVVKIIQEENLVNKDLDMEFVISCPYKYLFKCVDWLRNNRRYVEPCLKIRVVVSIFDDINLPSDMINMTIKRFDKSRDNHDCGSEDLFRLAYKTSKYSWMIYGENDVLIANKEMFCYNLYDLMNNKDKCYIIGSKTSRVLGSGQKYQSNGKVIYNISWLSNIGSKYIRNCGWYDMDIYQGLIKDPINWDGYCLTDKIINVDNNIEDKFGYMNIRNTMLIV